MAPRKSPRELLMPPGWCRWTYACLLLGLASCAHVVSGGDGDDTLVGRRSDDEIAGGGGSDLLIGASGDDVLLGEAGDDELQGDDGDDRLDGGAGADVLRGGDGADVLYGGAGVDEITGGAGNDTIRSGSGADVVTGGPGADIFVIDLSTLDEGHDRILDFNPEEGDRIVITGFDRSQLKRLKEWIGIKEGVVRVRPDFKNKGAIVDIGRDVPLSILLNSQGIAFRKDF